MNLERALVLNRYLHSLFGADRFDDLRRALKEQDSYVARLFSTLS
jgi:hypothetical protein